MRFQVKTKLRRGRQPDRNLRRAGRVYLRHYDARNRISMGDGRGNTAGYVYDARKRLLETDYPDVGTFVGTLAK